MCITFFNMHLDMISFAVIWLSFVGLSECFILEGDTTIHGTLSPTTTPDRCDIDAFLNCSRSFMTMVNQTENGVVFDQERLKNFYCGSENEYDKTLSCWRQSIDPTCGPNTYAASINLTLTSMNLAKSRFDTFCRNETVFIGMMTCQALLPNIDGYVKCVTGETLNKTIDPLNTCSLLATSTGCSYKYTKLMCPEFLSTLIESANSAGNCASNYDKTPEVTSCDENMIDACFKTFKPPFLNNSTKDEMYQFTCSGKSLKYAQCVNQVFDLCKGKQGFHVSNQTIDLKQYELQKHLLCSNDTDNGQLNKCQGLLPRLDGYQDCLLGENPLTSTDDQCQLFEDGLACSLKYTDLLCPSYFAALNKTISIPSSCKQSFGVSNRQASCDNDIEIACNVAYNPPGQHNHDLYEGFICSGRAKGYATCLQKVDNLCNSSNIGNTTVFQFDLSSDEQTQFICSHKSGYNDYIKCYSNFSTSQNYLQCISTDHSNATCRYAMCNLKSIDDVCPSTLAFHKMLNQNVLESCGLKGTISIPVMVSSASNIYLALHLLLPLLFTYLIEL